MSSSDPELKSQGAKEHQQLHPNAIMPMQPQQQQQMGGIGRAFHRPSSPHHPQPPPPINNHFQSRNNTNSSINVDNIFSSMGQGNNNAHRSNMNNNSNNIFHNFATMNDAANGPIPFRKYSDSTNYPSRSRSRSIASTANSNTATATAASNTNHVKADSDFFTRSGSDGDGLLSKSVGTASFMKRRNRNMSESESNPSTTIRHAGYLLKRSNLPYITSSSSSANNTMTAMVVVDDTIGGIDPLPDLSRVDDDIINGVFNLPFGGLDESVMGGDNTAGVGNTGLSSDSLTLEGMVDNASSNSLVSSPSEAKHFQPIMEPTLTTMTSVATEDTADEYIASTVDDEPCFCSPILQYFGKLFHIQQQSDALVTAKTTGIKPTSYSTNLNSPPSRRLPSSPTPTRPLPITPTKMTPAVYGYSMPLKSPARSDPVPISPSGGHNKTNNTMNTASMSRRGDSSNSLGNLSRSLSNGVIITKKMTAPNKKEYPPPPSDYIDPKDGHIWRAKYCVLEEGILYFYRTAEEGESDEAQAERCESRMYSEDQEDIVLGEYTSNSPTGRGMSSLGGGRSMLGAENRTSSRDGLYDLSKSPMPWKKSGFDFSKSPFHRSGSSVLTRGGSGGSLVGDDGSRSTTTPIMHHSNSTSTFHQDAEILWEKRVALDCVGAVRSSEQEHGYNAFELLAYGSDDRTGDNEQSDASTRDSSVGGGGQYQKQEIIDRLILRAGSSDDMNTWMFQFYRSLTSFMEQIVNSVRSGDRDSARRADLLGIIRPDSPGLRRLHGASVGKGSLLSPFVTAKQSFASSPTNSFGGGNFVGSLSHGHGRNALYRRQVRDNKSNDESVISPLPTPAGTPAGGSSPVDIGAPDGSSLWKKKQPSLMPSTMMVQMPNKSMSQNEVDLSSLRDLPGEGKEKEAAFAPAPKKYIPPHMRSAAPKKYIPPHMRSKPAAASGGNGAADEVTKKCTEKHVLLNDDEQKDKTSDIVDGASEVLDETLSDLALSATSTSSLLSRQLEDADDIISASVNVRLGGCADPTVIAGSIIDHHFIHRKASVVGNVRLEAYGGLGGGFLSSFGRRQSMSLLDGDSDLDTMMGSSSDSNNNPHIRSVLKWEVGASSECGVRNSNEDSYVVINNLDELISSQGLVSFSQQDLGQTRQQGLYAIFDGHVGNQAARFSAEKFHEILIEEQSSLASQDSACLSSIEDRADFILRKAFDRLDRDFCTLCTKDGRDWDCGSTALVALIIDDVVSLANLGDCSGFVCRLVSGINGSSDTETDDGWEELDPPDRADDPIWDRANGGGDTAYTSRGKLLWKEVTETHSALFDDERTRIEKANGWIIKETEIPIGQLHRMDIFDEDVVEIVKRCFADRMKSHRSDPVRQIQIARTCGDLAVSRAIGDRDFKAAYNMPSSNKATARTADLARSWEGPPVFLYPEGHSGRFMGDLVSSIPDIKSFKIGQEGVLDEFLLMACDGLWDVMDGDDAVRIAKNLLFDKKLSARDGAARLAELAQHLGSSDNITVVLIRFYWEEEEEHKE